MIILTSDTAFRELRVVPSADSAASIQAAIDQMSVVGGGVVAIDEGEYTLGVPIVHKSNVSVVGRGGRKFRLRPGAAWSGGADDAQNALWKIQGSFALAKLDSTLAAVANKGTTQITVAAVGTLQPLDWIWIQGVNSVPIYPNSHDGTNVVRREPIQVASTYIPGSTTIPLAWPLVQAHGSGLTVRGIVPALNTALVGADFDAPGGPVAVGVLAEYGSDAYVENLSGCGLSRALFNEVGLHDWRLRTVRCRGELNSITLMESAMFGSVTGITCDPSGKRFHAAGVARAMVHMRFGCTDIKFSDIALRHGVVGWYTAGSKHIQCADVSISDMVADQAVTTWEAAGEGGGPAQRIGVGFHSGATPVPQYGEWGHELIIGKLSIHDCKHDTSASSYSAYINDTDQFRVGSMSIVQGESAGLVNGMMLTDMDGVIERLDISGVRLGLCTENAFANLHVGTYTFRASPWESPISPNGNYAIQLGHAYKSGLRIDDMRTFNTAFPIWFLAGSFNDADVTIGRYNAESGTYHDLRVYYNDEGVNFSVGDTVKVEGEKLVTVSTYQHLHPKVRTPTGPADNLVIIAVGSPSGYGIGFVMAAKRGPATVRAADVIVPGDILEAQNGSRELAKNAASTLPFGIAMSSKAVTGTPAKVNMERT